MTPIYLGLFDGPESIQKEFAGYDYRTGVYDTEKVDLTDVEILLAYYEYADYSGEAFVLFRKCGSLYEVNGSHCSCHGLEGQWDPEETDIASLRHRIEKGDLGTYYSWGSGERPNTFAEELTQVLDELENNRTETV